MDEATWAALAATLTLLGLAWTWVSYRRHGLTTATRALGVTMLPVAAWLTGTLEMFTEIGGSVTDWATGLVLNPVTWTGIGIGGLGIVLMVLSGYLRDRKLGQVEQGRAAGTERAAKRQLPPASPGRREPPASGSGNSTGSVDDDLADIEALLKRRGIQ